MKNKYRWYKWRQHLASGVSEWKYVYVGKNTNAEECIDHLDYMGLLATWSELFRRAEVKRVTKVPEEILESEIRLITANIDDLENERIWLCNQRKK